MSSRMMSVMVSMMVVGGVFVASGCAPISSQATTTREAYSEGLVPASGPPASVGKRAARGQVAFQGSLEARGKVRNDGRTRKNGASGDLIPAMQLRGTLAVGVTERMEMGLTGRYSSGLWKHHRRALDTPDTIDDDLIGAGMTIRFGLVERGRLTLDFDSKLELLLIPRHQRSTGDVFDANPEPGTFPGTVEWETRSIRGYAMRLLPRVGPSASLELGPGRLLLGAGMTLLPTVIGHKRVETFCNEAGCQDPVNLGKFEPVVIRLAMLGHAGLEVDVFSALSMVALVHGALSNSRGGDTGVGGTLSLRLRL